MGDAQHAEPPVTLADYAFVTAGVSDGIAEATLLEHLQIDPHAWSLAEMYWLEQLTTDAERGALLAIELGELQARAREAWSRALPPLDEELRAWVDFQRLLGEAPDPLAYLADLGVLPADLIRLQQHWSAKLAADEGLRRQLGDILQQTPAPVEVPRPAAPTLASTPSQLDGTSFFRALDDTGEGIPFEAREQADEAYREAPELVTALPAARHPGVSIDETSALDFVPASLLLPFFTPDVEDTAAPPGEETAPVAPLPAADIAPPPEINRSVDETAIGEVILGDVLPFAEHAAAAADVPAPPERARSVDETAVGGVIFGDVLPFDEQPGPAPMPIADDLTAHPNAGQTGILSIDMLGLGSLPDAIEQPVFDVDHTAVGAMAPLFDPLPFEGDAPAPPSAMIAAPHLIGATQFVTVASFDEPLPFVAAATDEAPLIPGGLTLRQLAALMVELEGTFGNVQAVLSIYGLTFKSYQAHSEALRRLTTGDVEAAQAWEQAKATYKQWKAGIQP